MQGLLGLPPTEQSEMKSTAPVGNTTKGATACNTSKGEINARPSARSQTRKTHPVGAIMRKQFNATWCEGEMTKHDPISDFHHIKHTDGDAEEMTFTEVRQHRKPLQQCGIQYGVKQTVPKARALACKLLKAGSKTP